MAVILHMRRYQRKYDTNLDVFVQILAEPLFVLPRVAFPSSTASVLCRID